MTSEEFFIKGNECAKKGQFADAMNNYMESIRLDPNSPAVYARDLLENIMEFYCKDNFNP